MKHFFYLTCFLCLFSCESENLDDIRTKQQEEAPIPCKSEDISFQVDIVPLLSNYCYRCHDTDNSIFFGNGVNLEGYSNVKLYLDAQGTLPEEKLIYGNAARLPGFKPMPMGTTKINDCSLEKLRIWIEEGYTNN